MKALFFVLFFLITSCTTSVQHHENQENVMQLRPSNSNAPRQNPLMLTFAGDIMAHTVNFRMADYNLIYEDVAPLLHADDISFANFETPVTDSLPYETYPTFNVQSPYAIAAIDGGFDAFSLSNNHTNDQGIIGIESTREFFQSLRSQGVYSAGIKRDDGLSYDIIETQGWTILFAAVTEIVNSYNDVDAFDMYSYTEKRRQDLKNDIIALQNAYPHDMFVLGVHVYEPEYDTRVSDKRKAWFHELLDVGVDIVWGNHPHVTQEWELIKSKQGDKLIMYSIGNTISGQTYNRNYENPLAPREDTGTSIFLHADIQNKKASSNLKGSAIGDVVLGIQIDTTIIVTHRDEYNNTLIKKLTPEFIEAQNEQNRAYYTVRLDDMKNITGTTTWR